MDTSAINTLFSSKQTWIALVVAIFFMIFAYKASKVPGKKVAGFPKALVILVAIVLIIGGLWMSNLGTIFGMSTFAIGGAVSEGTNAPSSSNLIDGKCLTADTTTVTLSAQDAYLSTATGGTHRYRINGNPALTVSDAGTLSASPGDKISVLWMNGSTDSNVYFSAVGNYVVPCAGTATFTEKLAKNSTLTVRVFNTNGDLIDGLTVNQSLSAGDVKSLKMELEGAYQKEFPYGAVVVVEYNKTSMDNVLLQDRDTAVELVSASVPQAHSASLGTESARKAYLVGAIKSNAILSLTTVLDADDSTSPSDDGSDVIYTFFPRNYYVDDKNGGAYSGPSAEDEYNSVTRVGQKSSTLEVD